VLIGAGAGLLLLAGFVLVEHRRGERAMMPLSMFASKPFLGLTVLTFLLYGALRGKWRWAACLARNYRQAGSLTTPAPRLRQLSRAARAKFAVPQSPRPGRSDRGSQLNYAQIHEGEIVSWADVVGCY
jgi:hypothetical protein